MNPVIELDGLGVRFGNRDILEDLRVSLSGRTIGLLGPNGAGKSTLIQTLLGFVPLQLGHGEHFRPRHPHASSARFAPWSATCRKTIRSSPT